MNLTSDMKGVGSEGLYLKWDRSSRGWEQILELRDQPVRLGSCSPNWAIPL